jgi:hypothetical protein
MGRNCFQFVFPRAKLDSLGIDLASREIPANEQEEEKRRIKAII